MSARVLHVPTDEDMARANITRYLGWLSTTRGLRFETYDQLWSWSVTDLESFWASIAEFFDVTFHQPYHRVLGRRTMPGAEWFPGATLNYAEHALRRRDDGVAVLFRSEGGRRTELSFAELYRRTAGVAARLRALGVARGDRVAAYVPNLPETLITFLATASLGAVWSSCSPDFGVTAVLDRFRQIEPKVLLAVDGYSYKGEWYARRDAVEEISRNLPSLVATVRIEELWGTAGQADLTFEPVPFDHPLWILYSSGTTGLPKAIVHGHGGILLEHLKALSLHHDLGRDDRFFWFTSTGWMMWNVLAGGLLVGSSIVLYDGSPAHPDLGVLWRLAEETGTTYFGVSAPYLQACIKAGVEPARLANLSRLRGVGSTGAPLPAEGFEWVYQHVSDKVVLGSVSGGTDVCSGFVGCCPVQPVYAGEIQCRYLGAKVEAYDDMGRPLVDQVGELVLTEPLPSMPVGFWGDPDGRRYRSSYFETFPGVWRHGDWIKLTPRGTCVIYGRSDSTLNRGGVRIGTSELYRLVESVPEVTDSLAVDIGRLLLFVVVAEGTSLTDELRGSLAERIRRELSPRHVPDEFLAVPEIPRTLNGKKLEVPVKRILQGEPWESVLNPDTLANPEAIRPFLGDERTAVGVARPPNPGRPRYPLR